MQTLEIFACGLPAIPSVAIMGRACLGFSAKALVCLDVKSTEVIHKRDDGN